MNLHETDKIFHFFIYYNTANTNYTTNNREIICSITNTTKRSLHDEEAKLLRRPEFTRNNPYQVVYYLQSKSKSTTVRSDRHQWVYCWDVPKSTLYCQQ